MILFEFIQNVLVTKPKKKKKFQFTTISLDRSQKNELVFYTVIMKKGKRKINHEIWMFFIIFIFWQTSKFMQIFKVRKYRQH